MASTTLGGTYTLSAEGVSQLVELGRDKSTDSASDFISRRENNSQRRAASLASLDVAAAQHAAN